MSGIEDADQVIEDILGNRIAVETITSGAARVTIYGDDDETERAVLLLSPEDAQKIADAVREACSGTI